MYYHRYLEGALGGPVSRHKVRLLLGARQTGKTELLRHLLVGERTHVVNLGDTAVRRPGRARRGLLVCRCPRAQQLTDRVHAVPWDTL